MHALVCYGMTGPGLACYGLHLCVACSGVIQTNVQRSKNGRCKIIAGRYHGIDFRFFGLVLCCHFDIHSNNYLVDVEHFSGFLCGNAKTNIIDITNPGHGVKLLKIAVG